MSSGLRWIVMETDICLIPDAWAMRDRSRSWSSREHLDVLHLLAALPRVLTA
jgi:hypothetical protein